MSFDRAAFDQILRDTRERGFAQSDSDYVSDVASLAAPVFTPGNHAIVGAVSVIFKHDQYSPEDRLRIVAHLKDCAAHVASTL